MKIHKIKTEVLLILLGALTAAIATKYFIAPLKILSGGVYGLTLLLTRIREATIDAPFNTAYFTNMYLCLNIPLIIWGWFKLGKKLITYTLLNILAFSWFLTLLPETNGFLLSQDILTGVIVGGLLFGISAALIYKGNGSTGGFDIIAIYITKIKQDFSVNNLNAVHTIFLFVLYQIAFHRKFQTPLINNVLIYSIIFRFAVTLVANFMYPRHKIILCTVICKDHKQLTKLITTIFPHKDYSQYEVVGKQGKKRIAVEIALSFYESKDLIRMLKDKNIDNFFYATRVWRVHKNFAAIK